MVRCRPLFSCCPSCRSSTSLTSHSSYLIHTRRMLRSRLYSIHPALVSVSHLSHSSVDCFKQLSLHQLVHASTSCYKFNLLVFPLLHHMMTSLRECAHRRSAFAPALPKYSTTILKQLSRLMSSGFPRESRHLANFQPNFLESARLQR